MVSSRNSFLLLAACALAAISPRAFAQQRMQAPGQSVTVNGGASAQVPTTTIPITGTIPEPTMRDYCTQNPNFSPACATILRSAEIQTSSGGPQQIQMNKISGLSPNCKTAYDNAKKNCESGSTTSTAATLMQGMAGKTTPQDAYSACKALRAQSVVAAGGTAMVGTMCKRAASACESTCIDDVEIYTGSQQAVNDCSDMGHNATVGMAANVGLAGLGMSSAANCNQVIAAVDQYGCKPGDQVCIQNAVCKMNPSVCPNGANGTTMGSGFPNSGMPNTNDGSFGENGTGFTGYSPSPKDAGMPGGNDNASSGGAGGGAGSYPGGAGAGGVGGPGGPGYNKDIEHGYTGGGGGSGWGVSSVPVEGGGGRAGTGGDNIDLSKYLPGGELDPAKRGIAVADELRAQGITGANDLSNFEKITRMMNKKRPLMKPGDGK